MSDLRVTVVVNSEDLKVLRDAGFRLCVTRDVEYGGRERQGNVVFSSVPNERLAPNIQFVFQEKYQTFGTYSFQGGEKVTAGTQKTLVDNGQTVTLTNTGEANLSGSAQPGEPFMVRNEWQNPGSIAVDNYDPTTGQFHTIFVSPLTPINSTSALTPIKKFAIFWDMRLETDTMIDHTSSDPFHFDLTNTNEITLEFKDATWRIQK